mmetsp:Transcript_2868/g.6503  ORF Transcript_2868/g.6503 Transcript_2868/m.6503 type:complete len:443 (+) Transcript_2868:961-2289(+)
MHAAAQLHQLWGADRNHLADPRGLKLGEHHLHQVVPERISHQLQHVVRHDLLIHHGHQLLVAGLLELLLQQTAPKLVLGLSNDSPGGNLLVFLSPSAALPTFATPGSGGCRGGGGDGLGHRGCRLGQVDRNRRHRSGCWLRRRHWRRRRGHRPCHRHKWHRSWHREHGSAQAGAHHRHEWVAKVWDGESSERIGTLSLGNPGSHSQKIHRSVRAEAWGLLHSLLMLRKNLVHGLLVELLQLRKVDGRRFLLPCCALAGEEAGLELGQVGSEISLLVSLGLHFRHHRHATEEVARQPDSHIAEGATSAPVLHLPLVRGGHVGYLRRTRRRILRPPRWCPLREWQSPRRGFEPGASSRLHTAPRSGHGVRAELAGQRRRGGHQESIGSSCCRRLDGCWGLIAGRLLARVRPQLPRLRSLQRGVCSGLRGEGSCCCHGNQLNRFA